MKGIKSVKGAKANVKSEKDGSYTIKDLQPGVYKLIITKSGYKKVLEKKLVVDGPSKHYAGMVNK